MPDTINNNMSDNYQAINGFPTQPPTWSPGTDDVDELAVDDVIIVLALLFFLLVFCVYVGHLVCKYYYCRNTSSNDRNSEELASSENNCRSNTSGLNLRIIQEKLQVRWYDKDESSTNVHLTTTDNRTRNSTSSVATAAVSIHEKPAVRYSTTSTDEQQATFDRSKNTTPELENRKEVKKSDNGNEKGNSCAICLHPLQHHRVCHSNNLACQHVFHETCMVTWLQKANECPVCRRTYLVVEESA